MSGDLDSDSRPHAADSVRARLMAATALSCADWAMPSIYRSAADYPEHFTAKLAKPAKQAGI
jgi:hypothetical protein